MSAGKRAEPPRLRIATLTWLFLSLIWMAAWLNHAWIPVR